MEPAEQAKPRQGRHKTLAGASVKYKARIILDTVPFDQGQHLLLVRHLAMLLFLACDVIPDRYQVRLANAEGGVTCLPSEEALRGPSIVTHLQELAFNFSIASDNDKTAGSEKRICTWSRGPFTITGLPFRRLMDAAREGKSWALSSPLRHGGRCLVLKTA